MAKTKTVQARRRGDKQKANRILNCAFVENKDNDKQEDVGPMQKRMLEMFGNTKLPGVVYKGNFIPPRVLDRFSYLTR